jgi:hypothetical protein
VQDHTGLGRHLAHRHAPLLRRRLHQHLARGRAGLAEHGEVIAHAAAAPVGLIPRDGIGVARGIGGRLLDLDRVQVRVELVGHDHGHGGERALAHLGHGVDDGDDAVAVDADPLIGREDARALRAGPARADRRLEADDERTGGGEPAREQRAAREVDGRHHAPPFLGAGGAPARSAAARWMAARMRR